MKERHIELKPGICTWYSYRITEENRLNVYGTLNPGEDYACPSIGNPPILKAAPREVTHPIRIELEHPKQLPREGPLTDGMLSFELYLTDTDAERLAIQLLQYARMWRGEITSVEARATIKEKGAEIGEPTTLMA